MSLVHALGLSDFTASSLCVHVVIFSLTVLFSKTNDDRCEGESVPALCSRNSDAAWIDLRPKLSDQGPTANLPESSLGDSNTTITTTTTTTHLRYRQSDHSHPTIPFFATMRR